MYSVMERYRSEMLKNISEKHVSEYDWLMSQLRKIDVRADADYQRRYRAYWGISQLYIDNGWIAPYFEALEAAKKTTPTLASLCEHLSNTPSKAKGKCALQYSFSSKIIHMVAPSEPIFDSRVEDFYFFRRPGTKMSLGDKILKHDQFMVFLRNEYKRIIGNQLLDQSISDFRTRFNPAHFTKEKIVDSLIWAWVKECKSGGIQAGRIVYT